MNTILQRLLIFFCLLSFFGSIVYRFYQLNTIGIIITLILSILAGFFIYRKNSLANIEKDNTGHNFIFSLAALFSFLIFWLFSFTTLFDHATTKSLISPWQVTPKYFFLAYFFLTLILIYSLQKNIRWSRLLLTLHYFLSFSVALIIYKIGYGFDPFIHQATVGLIDKIGTVEPKPFYYVGQYSLVLIFHKITFLSIKILDKLLVPALAAIYLPFFINKLKNIWPEKISINLLAIILLVLPFSFLIVTTPQNLAYLFLLIIIFYSLKIFSRPEVNKLELIEIFIISLAAMTIHPVAGIPALSLVIILFLQKIDFRFKNLLSYLVISATALILPILFLFVEKTNSGAAISDLTQNLSFSWLKIIIPGQENFILNFIYLYSFNFKIIFCLLLLAGVYLNTRRKNKEKISWIYLGLSSGLFVSFLLTNFLPFKFLIYYERHDYAERLLICAAIFLLPYIILLFYYSISALRQQNKFIKISLVVLLASLISASLYLSYPRFDEYFNSKGFSVGQTDIDAVQKINSDAKEPYIVLANQIVSVAALNEFGFNHYYKNNIFYYPIPTGGPLYAYYLDMVYKKPTRTTMNQAMDLAGVKTGYFVLNKYWWAFNKILDEAKLEADSWINVDDGEIYVFKYKR